MVNYLRTLYKLEKDLKEFSLAMILVSVVKDSVKSFKEHLPMVQVSICFYKSPQDLKQMMKMTLLDCDGVMN